MPSIVTLGVVAFCCALVVGAEGQSGDSVNESAALRKERAARLEVMRRRARLLVTKIETAEGLEPVELIESPILRYGTPQTGQFDQTLWAWGRVGRPVAIATIGPAGYEMVSVADAPLSMTAKSGWKWTPSGSDMTWTPVSDAPLVGKTATDRARQMKDIARRFTANANRDVLYVELRLMEQPLHRYADPDHGLVDGALFSFAGGTNPEVLLLLEGRQKTEGEVSVWHYGCARMCAARCEARLGDEVVWSVPDVPRWDAEAPYFSIPYGDGDKVDSLDSKDAK